jgi:hypothetical protein
VCIIVDANLASLVFAAPTRPDFEPIIRWIDEGDGKLVVGGRNGHELNKVSAAARRIREWGRRGKAWQMSDALVDSETNRVKSLGICVSDDQHVIALARVASVRLVCSGDGDLHTDVKNKDLLDKPRGQVYQNASHSSLLRHTSGCVGRNK